MRDGNGSWERLERRDPRRRMRTREAALMSLVLTTVVVWHSIDRSGGVRAVVLGSISLWSVWVLSVVLHEIGHAVAARAANLEPVLILVGGGPSLVRREIFGVAFDVGCLPGSGVTTVVSRERQPGLKWRLLACYLGGPVVSLGLLLVGVVVLPQHFGAFRARADAWLMPGTALVLANGLIVVTSTVPMPRASDVASMANDLVQMLRLPGLDASRLDGLVRADAGARVARLCVLGRYQAAFEEARHRLALDPGSWMVRVQLADMLIFAGRYAEAALEYGALLDEPALAEQGIPPLGLALVANNYAWASYMLDEAAGLEAADRASTKAWAAAPGHASVMGTRGAVLVEKGSVVAGRKLLVRALRLHSDRFPRASVLACLAIASAKEGDREGSRRLLKKARALDPECDLLPRAEAALWRD